MKITYLFDSTTLWGGNKVALEQAEVLSDIGHSVTILSRDDGPDWYPLRLPVTRVTDFDAASIPESDIIIGTYWVTLKAAYGANKGTLVHLCQGYEGDYKGLEDVKSSIEEVYSYRIPKLTVSRHLDTFLRENFDAETYYIGQLLDHNVFFPARKDFSEKTDGPLRILVVGPFEVDFKNIPAAIEGILLARKRLPVSIELTRVSQFPLSVKEEEMIRADNYHFQVSHSAMGDIYRSADLFISTSTEAEGFGLPALEAMACGVPVILSNISSYRGFDETRDYAVFVDPFDHEAVAAAIERIWSDTDLRKKLVRRGLLVAGNFTKEKVRERLLAALEEILCRRNIEGTEKGAGHVGKGKRFLALIKRMLFCYC